MELDGTSANYVHEHDKDSRNNPGLSAWNRTQQTHEAKLARCKSEWMESLLAALGPQ